MVDIGGGHQMLFGVDEDWQPWLGLRSETDLPDQVQLRWSLMEHQDVSSMLHGHRMKRIKNLRSMCRRDQKLTTLKHGVMPGVVIRMPVKKLLICVCGMEYSGIISTGIYGSFHLMSRRYSFRSRNFWRKRMISGRCLEQAWCRNLLICIIIDIMHRVLLY